MFPDIKKDFHFGEFSRQEAAVGIRHLSTDGECPCLRIDLRISEIHKPSVGIYRAVGKSDGHKRVPFPCGVRASEIDIPVLAAQIVESGH